MTREELLTLDGAGLKQLVADAMLELANDPNTPPARKLDVLTKGANTLMRLQQEDRADARIAALQETVNVLDGETADA